MSVVKEVTHLLVDNLKLRGSVLPISRQAADGWAKDLDLPKGGDTVLYTGMMYQIIPFINTLVKRLELFEGTFLMQFTIFGRILNRYVNLSKFMGSPKKSEIEAHGRTLANIAKLLKKSGVKFGYLYEDDLYAGALAYDLGIDEAVLPQAKKIQELFKKNGVKRVITVDPHTTNMLREVFPHMLKDFKVEVKSYLEVLAEKGMTPVSKKEDAVVVHDSCVYARHEGVVDEPRQLLERAGVTIKNPRECKKLTFCCGGPAESLFPSKAFAVGAKRMKQLSKEGNKVAVMCPICYANLKHAANKDVQLVDMADYLGECYL